MAGLWRLRHNTARPDVFAADQAQPIDPLLIGQRGAVGCGGQLGHAPSRGVVRDNLARRLSGFSGSDYYEAATSSPGLASISWPVKPRMVRLVMLPVGSSAPLGVRRLPMRHGRRGLGTLGDIAIAVGAAERIAARVIAVGEVGNPAAGDDAGEPTGGGLEAARGDDAVAGGVLGQMP